jgi:hypothetical protein
MRLEVSEDCRLVQLEQAHADELYGLVEANRDYLAEWLPWAAGQTLEGTREFIEKTRRLGEWDLNRVEIHAATENRRSRAIPERLGFRQEGVLRDYERVGDRYVDIVVYSLLA